MPRNMSRTRLRRPTTSVDPLIRRWALPDVRACRPSPETAGLFSPRCQPKIALVVRDAGRTYREDARIRKVPSSKARPARASQRRFIQGSECGRIPYGCGLDRSALARLNVCGEIPPSTGSQAFPRLRRPGRRRRRTARSDRHIALDISRVVRVLIFVCAWHAKCLHPSAGRPKAIYRAWGHSRWPSPNRPSLRRQPPNLRQERPNLDRHLFGRL